MDLSAQLSTCGFSQRKESTSRDSQETKTEAEESQNNPISAGLALDSQVQAAIQQMTENPEAFAQMASRAFAQAGPEMIEQARKAALGPEGQRLAREMQGKGMTPAQAKRLRKQVKQVQPLVPPAASQHAVLIRATRVAKEVDLPADNPARGAAALLRCEAPAELNCSRLAAGPLAGKAVRVFCDPSIAARNKRISRLAGFPMGGDVIVFCQGESLRLADLEGLEKILLER